jgi:tRNA(Ile2)-agmatinylcytidine synthase
MLKTMHIGMDDTDSTRNGCTTYIAALLVEQLEKFKARLIDYPNLIRLNPNIPWKTRGNGALCLRFKFNEELEAEIKRTAIALVEEYSDLNYKGTDPGIVFFKSHEIPEELRLFARNAETGIVTLKEATKLINKFEGEALGFNACRGIIGALAAIGETLQADHTFELIAYRSKENRGSTRQVDEASIFEMDRLTQPFTFNNVDLEKHRVIITPRGPDPILLGIRGETPETVKKAFSMVKPLESVERWVVFRTNQGTDAHLIRVSTLNALKEYSSVIVKGIVSRNPRIVPVRHVIFSIKDKTDEVDCAAYEPTGELRKVAKELIEGDEVEVCGAVRRRHKDKRLTLNLEKIRLLSLSSKLTYQNPNCQSCGKRLESMGKGQGFRCRKCGSRHVIAKKITTNVERKVRLQLFITSTRSQRHLTKPLRRYGLEKNHYEAKNMIKHWHSRS